jgi:hypothetical protein
MSAMKAANKDLKGTMKTLKIDDIDVRPSLFGASILLFQLLRDWSLENISSISDRFLHH